MAYVDPAGFQTVEEQMNYFYNRTPEQIAKAEISTDSAGVYNPVYGASLEYNFNLEANLWSALPKSVWDRAGFRIIKNKAPGFTVQDDSLTDLGGTAESGPIGEGLVGEYQEISVKPKLLQYQIQVSDIMQKLVENSRDDNYGSLAQQVVYAGAQFRENLNLMLNYSIENNLTTSQEETNSYLNLETLDRIISSQAESTYVEGVTGLSTPMNPWAYVAENQIDRSSGTGSTDYDSVVVSPSGTIGTAQVLTDSLIRKTMADIRVAGGQEISLFYGGQDTYNELQSIWTPQVRIPNTADVRSEFSLGVNGVKTFTGTGVGLHISTVYGIPFIPSKDAINTDTTNNVGDLYLLNTDPSAVQNKPLLGISTLWPIVYYEAGPGQPGYPYVVGQFSGKGAFVSRAETIATNFKKQGKIRDILAGN